ncbi:MAG: carbohydrate kinase [Rhodobacteraceae bacterium]|nr:carbohydrate kinase [Paracoccaceae bacterium]
MGKSSQVIIGIDAGTSVIKAVAFDLNGQQLGAASVRNSVIRSADGGATQCMDQTWKDCVAAITELLRAHAGMANSVVALAVTGQGDGTWLVGKGNRPVGPAWLWLDARAAPTVADLAARGHDGARFAATGTGLNTCQQGAQMAHMARTCPDMLNRAQVALHCKDWLYLNLTGMRATDPSEASFTFGNFRTRQYDDTVIAALGLSGHRHLLPPIIDGTQTTHPLTAGAAAATGLPAGLPVCLGYVDMVMTALGAGVHTGEAGTACSAIGSTGVHLRAFPAGAVHLNAERTGYVICLPVPDMVTQVQTNMAATLNIDWILGIAAEIVAQFGISPAHADLVARIDDWLAQSPAGQVVYLPYISDAGERGPFVDAQARAAFVGLSQQAGFATLLRAVVESLGLAARDCYSAMGDLPQEVRLSGGAARSAALRQVISAVLDRPVRVSTREEAGAAGCAMMAAVAIGAYPDMNSCIREWVVPELGAVELPDAALAKTYDRLFTHYGTARRALVPVWQGMAADRASPAAQSMQKEPQQ